MGARVPRGSRGDGPRRRRAARARGRGRAAAVRRAGRPQGPLRGRRPARDGLQPDARGQRRVRGLRRVGAAAGGGHGARRPHPHARVRLRRHDRPGGQPVGPRALGGWVERRLGGRARRPHGPGGDRNRHGRLGADPGGDVGHQLDQGDARARADRRGPPAPRPPRPATLDHAGPMARTVADCAALLQAMADGGADTTPLMPPPAPLGPMPLEPSPGPRPLEGTAIAVLGDAPTAALDPDVADGLEAAAQACERLGARVFRAERPAAADLRGWALVATVDFWAYHEQFAERSDQYRPFLRKIAAAAGSAGPAAAYVRAQEARAALVDVWERWMRENGVDLLLEATIPAPAPPRTVGYAPELPTPDPHILLTFPWNVTGFPVAALPAGLGARSGLPVGMSLIGPRGAEAAVAAAAIDLQEHALAPPVAPYATP